MKYDKATFLRYIPTDMFLAHTWADYQTWVPADQLDTMLKAMFNSYILEESNARRAYQKFVNRTK